MAWRWNCSLCFFSPFSLPLLYNWSRRHMYFSCSPQSPPAVYWEAALCSLISSPEPYLCPWWTLPLHHSVCLHRVDGVMRTMNTEKLLKTIPIIQNQMDALLDFNVSLKVKPPTAPVCVQVELKLPQSRHASFLFAYASFRFACQQNCFEEAVR